MDKAAETSCYWKACRWMACNHGLHLPEDVVPVRACDLWSGQMNQFRGDDFEWTNAMGRHRSVNGCQELSQDILDSLEDER